MKILFITLSNIGDVILSLPALDRLINVYPKAEITVICGVRASGVFEDNPYIRRVITFNRQEGIWGKLRLLLKLRKNYYDLIVDLKNSALPFLLSARYKTYPWFGYPASGLHMHQRHLYKVLKFTRAFTAAGAFKFKNSLHILQQDRLQAGNLLNDLGVSESEKLIVISPGARSHIKRWPEDKFAQLSDLLVRGLRSKVVLVGDTDDLSVCQSVASFAKSGLLNLCGKTTIKSLAALIERASLVISNDSCVMHLASYLDSPTVAIFGATDYKKYGPWGKNSEVLHSKVSCSPCEAAQCKTGTLECLGDIKVEEVYAAAKRLL